MANLRALLTEAKLDEWYTMYEPFDTEHANMVKGLVEEVRWLRDQLEREPDDKDDLEMFQWLAHAVVKYDNVDLSRPENVAGDKLGSYGVGLGDPSNGTVDWYHGDTLREAIREAMRDEHRGAPLRRVSAALAGPVGDDATADDKLKAMRSLLSRALTLMGTALASAEQKKP